MISRRSWTTLLLAFAVVGLSSHDSCFGAEKDADVEIGVQSGPTSGD